MPMAIRKIVHIGGPFGTVPETAERLKQVDLAAAKNVPQVGRGEYVKAYADSYKAWGIFREVQFRKKPSQVGVPVSYSTQSTVTIKATAGNSARRAGIALGTPSVSQYGFIQVHGVNFRRIVTDTGVAAATPLLIKDEATDGMCDTPTNTGTQIGWVLGRAFVADSGSFMAPGKAFIDCM